MNRRAWVCTAALLWSSCAAPPAPQGSGIVPLPIAAPPTNVDITAWISDFGSEDFARRDKASAELTRLGQDPARQADVVSALRAAATAVDPEARLRARDTLRAIDRSESIVPGTDRTDAPMSYSVSGAGFHLSAKFWHRLYADGSSELEIEVNDGARELFSGSTPAELAARVNEAARSRGYSKDQFEMLPDGGFRFGQNTTRVGDMTSEHLLRSWGLWVAHASRSDGLTPPAAWGGWVVQARSLTGKAFESGLHLRDVILDVDGKKAASIRELEELLGHAREIHVLRLEGRSVVVAPK